MAVREKHNTGTPTARYIAIKRFAVHDGPGVRTTLFLKGCPLKCVWCHNPEGISAAPELAFHEMKCTGCGACSKVCSNHRLDGDRHDIDRSHCRVCGKCVSACPSGALELFGREITVAEAAEQLLADRIFYADGGGVTVSGGEPLLQSDFCAALFRRLKREGVHCAADTSGCVPWSAFEQMLPVTDLFLYDIKAADPETHRRCTGRGNELIRENLRRLNASGAEIEIRMPLIPGVNLGESDLRGAGEMLSGLDGVRTVQLLPYHDFARSKYRAIDRRDTMPQVAPPTAEELAHAAEILKEYHPNVILPDI